MRGNDLKVRVKNIPSEEYDYKINESIKVLLDDISSRKD